MPELLETDFIALRKIPYTDNSIVLSGISGEYGRLGFMVKGVSSHKDYPVLDIFRLLHVEFIPGNDSLSRIRSVDLVEDFSALAADYDSYGTAAWISGLSLMNVMPMLPHPLFANAVEVALRRLSRGGCCQDAIKTCVAIAFIFEEGWLSHAIQTPRGAEQCRCLLEMAAGGDGPSLTPESWHRQLEWCLGVLQANECKLP